MIAKVGQLERELHDYAEIIKDYPDPPTDPANPPHPPAWVTGIYQGLQKYTRIEVPALAIFALPHALSELATEDPEALRKDPAATAKVEAVDYQRTGSQPDAFERGVQKARVVRIAHASHFIFGTNEQDVLREVRSFLERLYK